MSIFIKELVRKKLKQISSEELMFYSKQYGFSLSKHQAMQISNYLNQNSSVDPFKFNDREKMLRELARITDIETAQQARKLLDEVIKSYGLEHLFE
ncbi:DUF2624 domain-containing protein [Oceanobacillus halophilus]|uniref:DUF2624 domain-containing protein n=1 Tax=Oceanobacillus halophilus TaxID=930130 RepID=A0A495ACW6_9BACI|nr:DUF2624 domain-containing protein [Oceanobacillus halophilus]RKQ37806.1 DUF2624 domain-containing protein [Oceanobacillus halophilus]